MLRIFLLLDCSSFVSLCKTPNTGVSATGKTRLDKERVALCIAEMVTLCNNNQGFANNIYKIETLCIN